MNTNRPCGCKSFNSCYRCEAEYGISPNEPALEKIDAINHQKIFCPLCRHLYEPNHLHICGQGLPFKGIELYTDFISVEEEKRLISDLDHVPWDISQSGRRKQNYGPKANFKAKKVKLGSFKGFPVTTQFVQDRFNSVPSLVDYKTVEQCSIEYRPETGARIDPHIDDCWIWGERIVQLNLLSDSMLTMFPFKGDPFRYNLADVTTYPQVMDELNSQVKFNPFKATSWPDEKYFQGQSDLNCVIRVPLPRRSLLVLYGQPRYAWEHCVLRRDITSRRIVIAYRELTPTYLPHGPKESIGREILENGAQFFQI